MYLEPQKIPNKQSGEKNNKAGFDFKSYYKTRMQYTKSDNVI